MVQKSGIGVRLSEKKCTDVRLSERGIDVRLTENGY